MFHFGCLHSKSRLLALDSNTVCCMKKISLLYEVRMDIKETETFNLLKSSQSKNPDPPVKADRNLTINTLNDLRFRFNFYFLIFFWVDQPFSFHTLLTTLPRPCYAFVLLWLSVSNHGSIMCQTCYISLTFFRCHKDVNEFGTDASFFQLFFGKPFQFLAKRKKNDFHILPFISQRALRWISLQTAQRLDPLNLPLCFPHSTFNENESLLLYCQDWVVGGGGLVKWGRILVCWSKNTKPKIHKAFICFRIGLRHFMWACSVMIFFIRTIHSCSESVYVGLLQKAHQWYTKIKIWL